MIIREAQARILSHLYYGNKILHFKEDNVYTLKTGERVNIQSLRALFRKGLLYVEKDLPDGRVIGLTESGKEVAKRFSFYTEERYKKRGDLDGSCKDK